ncbi:non-canonical purine NTP pyrophosphatase [Clostridium oryzae]|uniref:Non-canonical purine NTP pyrophosphatase n=1 Tax=Clostridium oryzae TaxID=1450648 RepID=A0A1V4IWE1_9CLOT|nr:non-canonical purine NTP pyrophosphatase [Clostridium oryzae]OPJ63737.1 Non-canonical purine NTP pyrophosphatase [Clostridium oryzae]
MRLLYGTTNAGKLDSMKRRLRNIDVEVVGLNELNIEKISVEETGNNPLENAVIKAKAYYDKYRIPLFSCDTGLYIDGLEESRQPGVYVRRADGGIELDDEQMLEYYTNLAKELGGSVKAQYRNAICLIMDDNNIFKYDGEDIGLDKFIITDKPYPKMTKGFPLDSISIDIATGKYFIEMDDEVTDEESGEDGFARFIGRALQIYNQRCNK